MGNSLQKFINEITAPSAGLINDGQARLNSLTKPVGSLGRLEELALKIWRVQGKRPLRVDPAIIYTVAGDHGVTEEAVSLYPPSVTRQMVKNFLNGGAAINAMCNSLGIEQTVADAGCFGGPFQAHPRLLEIRAGNGTANFTKGPAMTASECQSCIKHGIAIARKAFDCNFRTIGVGEMGIGNTTSAAALFSAFFELRPEDIAGPGAGLPSGGLSHKIEIIHKALQVNQAALASKNPLEILQALGGFEIAAMAGIILGSAHAGMLTVIDGYISTAAFAAAWKLCPAVSGYCIFSHKSKELGHGAALSLLNGKPLLDLDMRLGEGTGAALAISLMRSSAAIFNEMATFDSVGISRL